MPEHFRALIVILVVASLAFALAKNPIVHAKLLSEEQFEKRRNLWYVVTIIAFFAHSYWIYIILTSLVVIYQTQRDTNPLAIYAIAFVAVPNFAVLVPGFGIVNYLFLIDHVRLLNIIILLPLAVSIVLDPNPAQKNKPIVAVDAFVVAYILYVAAIYVANESPTQAMRAIFYLIVDMLIPYYVFSRFLNTLDRFRDLIVSFLLGLSVLAAIAIFESARGWLIYESLRHPLGIGPPPILTFQLRHEGGALRAMTTVGSPIALGYLMMLGLALYTFLVPDLRRPRDKILAGLVLFGGLIAAMSRGPWVGAAIALLLIAALGPGMGRRLTWVIGSGGAVLLIIIVSPWGASLIDYLPFVGTVQAENIDYRQRLFDVSMIVFWQNPIFGSYNFITNPILQQMRQGQGIIDIVNTYLQVALPYGFVGLFLFCGFLLSSVYAVWRQRSRMFHHQHLERLGRALFGAMIGVLITIGTVSSISVIPAVYWALVGTCAAYAGMRPPERTSPYDSGKGFAEKKVGRQ